MAIGLKRNILVGAASIYISTDDSSSPTWDFETGEPLPTLTANQSATVPLDASAAWENVGFTQEGLEFSYEPDYGEVEVDQLLDSAKLFKQSLRVMVNTTMVEATLEKLLFTWNQPVNTLASDVLTISPGELGDDALERSLVAVGKAPRTAGNIRRERVYHVRRILSIESTSHALKRNEATVFPVSFRLLPAVNEASGNEYGTVRDRTLT